MRTILSDDGQYVFSFHDDSDEPEMMTKGEFAKAYGEDALPRKQPVKPPTNPPILEYLGEFKALIDACGMVSYNWRMRENLKAGINKVKIVAASYQHDLKHYDDELTEWRAKANRAFTVLSFQAEKLGYEMPERKVFLNDLAILKDRRKAYKGYLETCIKNSKTLSPAELEAKFQQRLQKRLNKAKK